MENNNMEVMEVKVIFTEDTATGFLFTKEENCYLKAEDRDVWDIKQYCPNMG